MADNDKAIIQKIKYKLRKCEYKLQYFGNQPDSIGGGTEYLKNLLKTDRAFMICRIGAEESRTINRWMRHQPYTERNIHNILYNAGVFPNDTEEIDRFCSTYSSALKDADGVFTWGCYGEGRLIHKYCIKNVKLLRYDMNNILFYDEVWTTELANKKVLIVHPFIDTIKEQYKKRNLLFKNEKLPTFKDICFVRAIQSNAGEHLTCGYKSWMDALRHMEYEISSKDYDIALIGAGAYGIPLAAFVKRQGKQAIHMGSNLQILFGIRGKRWDSWTEWTPYFNEYWVYPSEFETPKGKDVVEGGSYWK